MHDASVSELPLILTIDELKQFRIHRQRRDNAAMKVGVALIELENMKNQQIRVIHQSLKEETEFVHQIAKRLGIDIERTNFTIDYETGKILITGIN